MRVSETSTIEITIDQAVPADSIVDINSIIDISRFADKDGLLSWNAPAGNWTIVRIGYTPTGAMVQAAPEKGQGLECDKFSRQAMTFHFNNMMEKLLPLTRSLAGKGKMGLEIDSYEAGAQNWTAGFELEFQKRCGYSLTNYLLILTGGRIVGNIDITERFTWDLRRVQAELIAENNYGCFHELCKQHGIVSYVEPYDSGPMEEMQIGSAIDINIGEFWSGISSAFPVKNPSRRTVKMASSITHINNKKITGAESFTAEPDASRWLEYPFALKAVGDLAFVQGANRMIIHRFAHQPHPTAAPGMTMGPWGIHFDRTNTWWKPGKAWIKYLQRCQAMLQQGHFVADILYFTGEDANMYTRVLPDELMPEPPAGYNYDLINAQATVKHIKVVDNRILLANGNSYSLLIIPDLQAISISLLEKLRELVQNGMMLLSGKPTRSTGLSDYADKDARFRKIVEALWGDIDGDKITEHQFGKGKVFSGRKPQEVLQRLNMLPDFTYNSNSGDAPIIFTHRRNEETEIYFLSNQRRSYEELVCSFRVNGKSPELWNPATGAIIPVVVYEQKGAQINIPVQLEPYGSVLVVFRKPANSKNLFSIWKDNRSILSSQTFAASTKADSNLAENFTISFWAKPETNILLGADLPADSQAKIWTQYYALYPSTGMVYGQAHATCGIAVGRNGVAVWENNSGMPGLVLSVPVSIQGWTLIVVHYKDNVPFISVNYNNAIKGVKSKYTVHAPTRKITLGNDNSFYNGDIWDLRIGSPRGIPIPHVQPAISPIEKSPFIIEPIANNIPAVLIKENGRYQFQYADGKKTSFTIANLQKEIVLKDAWEVSFPENSGAPAKIILPKLVSLHKHREPGVRYFSGTATYQTNFSIPKKSIAGKRWFLDLGIVEVMAEVFVNEKSLGILWKRPYEVDITEAIREGKNSLTIQVTNLWTNRLIGDEQLPDPDKFTPGGGSSGIPGITGGGIVQLPDWYNQRASQSDNGRISFTTWKHYTRDSPLAESGLIGPVVLRQAIIKTV